MNLKDVTDSLRDCPCGMKHVFDLERFECGRGLVRKTGDILKDSGFGKKLFVVSDEPAFKAADGILDNIAENGFEITFKLFPSLKYAYLSDSRALMITLAENDGILSIGTGSVNDICRYAAARTGKPLAIFATAPSMDGFASDSAPLIENNFKISYPCRQPKTVIADTEILAASPAELKSAGYGDIVAKYLAITDWKTARYSGIGEHYCENVVSLVRDAVERVVSVAGSVTSNDPEAAGHVMETLVLTGCSMQLVKNTRPASGAEHIISHFWEIHKLDNGIWPDYHGKKVGVATCLLVPMYKSLLSLESISIPEEKLDMDEILSHYNPKCHEEIIRYNNPSICNAIDKKLFYSHWDDIRESIANDLPSYESLVTNMKSAGCITDISEAGISPELSREALIYSPYMRRRLTILRLWKLLGMGV